MDSSIFCLLPPVVVLIVGYFTRRVLISLFCGIIAAGFVAADFNFFQAAILIFQRFWKNFELYNLVSLSSFWKCKNLFICVFLFALGAIISLLNHSGGAYAYRNFMQKRLKNSQNTQVASVFLSVILFIDDYFSSLTVGSVMTPLTDLYKIPRAKLAFLVDSMAAPLAILCPFSSWFAAIIGFLSENGISSTKEESTLILESPFSIYMRSIPYIFYSFIIIACCVYIIRRNISFGLMKKHEIIAHDTGNLFGGNIEYQNRAAEEKSDPKPEASMFDFFIPIFIFIFSIVCGMVYSGGYTPINGSVSFFQALQNSSVSVALFTGGVTSLILIVLYFLVRRTVTLKLIGPLCCKNAKIMFQTMMILMLAWTLGEILRNDLSIGPYLAELIHGSVQLFLLPLLFFLISLMIAFATGTSWGTAAVMLPIAIPTTLTLIGISLPTQAEQVPLLFPVIGAVFSGCIAGDHLSPISDTTIMTSSSTRMPHIDHVQTQMGYAIPMIIVTAIGFTVAGWMISYGILTSLLVSGVVSAAFLGIILEVLHYRSALQSAAALNQDP